MRKILLPGVMVSLLLVFLFVVNNRMKDRYIDLGEDAPMPTELHPIVEEKKEILIEQATELNIEVVITDGIRSIEEQNELYAQGRTTSGDIVTNARGGESYHNYGLAIDFALIRQDSGEITWDTEYDGNNNGESDWLEVADLARELGFEWGGDWRRSPDYPHLQMDFGLSINQLQNGLRPRYDKQTDEELE